MTGVLALAQGLGPDGLTPFLPVALALFGGILLLVAGLVANRQVIRGTAVRR